MIVFIYFYTIILQGLGNFIKNEVINLINKRSWYILTRSNWESSIRDFSERGVLISDADGILFVKSVNKNDPQIEENLPDTKAKKEVEFIWDYINGITHKCGQPCRSWHIRGKPCEIVTFGGSCHYH